MPVITWPRMLDTGSGVFPVPCRNGLLFLACRGGTLFLFRRGGRLYSLCCCALACRLAAVARSSRVP
eukprot:10580266-Prorocentrum_lima.AAC.1